MNRPQLFFAALIAFGISAVAATESIPLGDKGACMEGPMAQFGRYIGNWDIADSQLSQNGQAWKPGAGARWNFVCIGDGTAVQDFWLPNDGGVGTNLRTWNPDSESWDIAWAVTGLPGFAHITAVQDELGNVVMHYKAPVPDPLRRITFFPPDDSGWDWVQEWSTDGGKSWFPVYRIRATPSD